MFFCVVSGLMGVCVRKRECMLVNGMMYKLIDLFRGACTVNRNDLVVGHVKRVYHEDAFGTLNVVRKR